jgi:DNA-binding Xre family transcriptional regulator
MMVRLTLQEYMDKNRVTRYALSQSTGIRYHIIDKYYKNKVVRYDGYVLDKICTALDCSIEDILTHE